MADDDAWLHNRLPVRRVAGTPEVRARLLGLDDDSDDEFQHELDDESASAASSTEGDGLADWQREWLGLESDSDGADADDDPAVVGREDGLAAAGVVDNIFAGDSLVEGSRAKDDRHDAVADDGAGEPAWWEGIPAVRQVLLDGLDLGPATILLGENGSGKSTLVEGTAMAYGLAPEGGSAYSRHRTRRTESGLDAQLEFIRNGLGARGGYFLRAETMHAFFSYLEDHPGNDPEEPLFHQLSHGESFVALVEVKFKPRYGGLYVLDEPESALSFENQLRLLRHLTRLMETGRHQILMATHSPILAALPGAVILELDERGLREVEHDDARLVREWRDFMNDPARFLG